MSIAMPCSATKSYEYSSWKVRARPRGDRTVLLRHPCRPGRAGRKKKKWGRTPGRRVEGEGETSGLCSIQGASLFPAHASLYISLPLVVAKLYKMAAFLRSHGVLSVVALAMVMVAVAPGAAGDEPGHHVVGGDRGWDVASNIAEWSIGKVFKVGDSVWFAYSAADESILELGSREEYEACDTSNPIRMYTDGLNEVPLDGEGSRYFVSGRPESCRGGLKLHVAVEPQQEAGALAAEGPAGAAVAGSDQVPGADGPTACVSPSLSWSFLKCVGMTLLRPVVA